MHHSYRDQTIMISTSDELLSMVQDLHSVQEIAFDTEYDSFKREYGFKLLLMQIFDGEKIYIIDPLAVQDLTPLWGVLENPSIMKTVYSGSEDIALMKQLGCQVRNIFDVQIAATLCNHLALNLGDLIASITGEPADKRQQKSDWRARPLTNEQIIYAANDVIHLIQLKKNLNKSVEERQLVEVLAEENRTMELITPREHIPELKGQHYKYRSQSFCVALLKMILLRDTIARELNLPPVRVVDTRYLEEALEDKQKFLSNREFRSFHPRIRNNDIWKEKFLSIIALYDPNDTTQARKENAPDRFPRRLLYSKEEQEEIITNKYDPVKVEMINIYGERTAEFLLRGLKKDLISPEEPKRNIREYQKALLHRIRTSVN